MKISTSGISKFLNEEQTEIKLVVLDALCIALEYEVKELLFQTSNSIKRNNHEMIN